MQSVQEIQDFSPELDREDEVPEDHSIDTSLRDSEGSRPLKRQKTIDEVQAEDAPSVHRFPSDHAALYRSWSSDLEYRPPFAPGEWVRILYGLYEGDIGQVYRTTRAASGETGYLVLVVPRLHSADEMRSNTASKTLPRPQPTLFDPKSYGIHVTDEKGKGRYAGYRFQGMWLTHGLLLRFFPVARLLSVDFVPPDTPGLFVQHPFSQKFPAPVVDSWSFESWDEVDVSAFPVSKASSCRGHLLILQDGQFRVDVGAGEVHAVEKMSLKKVVIPGDMVVVLTGPEAGREGVVIEKHGTLLGVGDAIFPEAIRFFTHVNCVRRRTSFVYPSQSPWIGSEVTVVRGPLAQKAGVVRAAQVSRHRDCLTLSLYVPVLDSSVRVDDVDVLVTGTKKSLSDVYPLGPTPGLDRSLRKASVPWKGVQIGIIHGHWKGLTASVTDVNRSSKSSCASGIEITVELDLIRAGMGLEKVFYDHVRELRSGWPLNDYRPITEAHFHLLPNPNFVGNVVHFSKTVICWKVLALEVGPARASTPIPDDDRASTPIPGGERASTPISDNGPNQEMDIWNPGYENWEPSASPPSSPPSFPPPSSPPPPPPSAPITASAPHFLSHPKLVGMKIYVDITSGTEATLDKTKGVYVELHNSPEARLSKTKTKSVSIPLDLVSRFRKPPTLDSLMVVISGENQHIGKVVRRAGTLGVNENLLLVCAVFDGQGEGSKMTGEILELTADQVATVEEPSNVRFWATNLMQLIRAHARVALKRRKPGDNSYESWSDLIKQQNENIAKAQTS
ncbi:hypothetical protein V5O48_016129 [Marasmius crinis-equi]|uniref:KOW domain-containing protein n=1 Tax=Marasmius crinis-equi TaxID=585013 RepID=A0ABR3ESQ7_9AGAR